MACMTSAPHLMSFGASGSVALASHAKHAGCAVAPPRHMAHSKNLAFKAECRLRLSPMQRLSGRSPARTGRRRYPGVAMAASPDDGPGEQKKVAPLVPQSPAGQFLSQILGNHPHLFSAAAEQQLERLVAEKEQQELKAGKPELQNSDSLILYRRMNDVKEADRRSAIEDIIYALVVEKFLDAKLKLIDNIPLLPHENLTPAHVHRAMVPRRDAALQAVHSKEMRQMVIEHLQMSIVGSSEVNPMQIDDQAVVDISRMRSGQMYAASVMYGYFLKRMDERYQLDKKLKAATEVETVDVEGVADGGPKGGSGLERLESGTDMGSMENPLDTGARDDTLAAEFMSVIRKREAQSLGQSADRMELKEYIMSFTPETFQENAKMRSRESVNVIERHTAALFGEPELLQGADGSMTLGSNDHIRVTLLTVKTLVLEAMAFGSFLWEVESYVDSRYRLTQ